jgi:hypothetical protein
MCHGRKRRRDNAGNFGIVSAALFYNKKDSGSHTFGACFRKQDACRLASLALGPSVRRFHGCSQPPFLFSVGGGHATVASSFLCVWLHALGVHKLRHDPMPFLGLPAGFAMQEACHLASLAVDLSTQHVLLM